ncbi:hypothetical protein [Catelliglobosispora koreensis]|uniref:hypothetical protein n=1 Tax=Catelliglobosispora koreensis TaxID=129052 RepID=UPI0012FA649A|nr:hypothetical protein [Catelliglobosispora koreensis]
MTPSDTVAVAHLVVRQEDEDEYLVGDPDQGIYFSVPGQGARLIELFAQGHTIAEAADILRVETGADVDALDFATEIAAAGVVGVERPRGRFWAVSKIPARFVKPLFGRVAWCFYAGCFVGAVTLFVLEPGLLPTYEDLFFTPSVLLSIMAVNVLALSLTGLHEVWHALAGAALGVRSTIRLDQRAYFPVLQTDLTGVWAVPPGRRFGPFLAGMAIDSVVLCAALTVKFGWTRGWFDVPPTLIRILGVVVLTLVVGTVFQALAFLRTDLYMVLLTATGGRNLHRITQLSLKKRFWRLTAADAAELDNAHPRDVSTARWYQMLYLAGLLWLCWYAFHFLLPSARIVFGWPAAALTAAPWGSADWWEALALAALAAVQLGLPLFIIIRKRLARR